MQMGSINTGSVNLIYNFFFKYFSVVLLIFIFQTGSAELFPSLHLETSAQVQSQAARDVLCRTLPDKCSLFNITVDRTLLQNGKDTFTIYKKGEQILISGSSGVACTWGFHFYLKHYCKCHIGWQTRQLKIPDELPHANITITAKDRFRYYQNVCTTSYSFVWWDIDKWRDHIDWMALNGINIALAPHGQEVIWQRVYRQLHLTEEEINEHFSGPAFLSWQRMGNIRGWGGPLSTFWHLHSLKLQHFIVEAMVNLTIIPVLPAFAGHVPKAFGRLFPNASLIELSSWNKFNSKYCCPLFLDPTDQLFHYVGKLFLSEMVREFGAYHYYNSDPFNENVPTSGDLNFLKATSNSIYKSMSDVDPSAVWLLQGWMFIHDVFYWTKERVRSLLTAVEKGKILILDLQSEQWPQYNRLEMYFGQPFVWCMLHNFGGTLGMFGDSQSINSEVYNARSAVNSTMVGTGLTPEGINQNYVMYDLMLESALRDTPVLIDDWIANYTIRRYGQENEDIIRAWTILMRSVYNFNGLDRMRGKYAINRRPSLDIKPWSWYKSADLFLAWKLFVNSSDSMKHSECYRYDLTDITRQVLQYKGDQIYPIIIDAFYNKDLNYIEKYSAVFMNLLEDLDEILSTNKGFLLGNWLEAAKSLAYTDEDKIQFEYNARNQITLWGPNGEIIDYASKQWAGIVADFFALRWRTYLSAMYDSVKNNYKFNKSATQSVVFTTIERPFTFSLKTYPSYEIGDTIQVATNIFERWSDTDAQNYPDVPIRVQSKEHLISEDRYKKSLTRHLRVADDDVVNEDLDYINYNVIAI